MFTAFVLQQNDAVVHVLIGSQHHADAKLAELKADFLRRNPHAQGAIARGYWFAREVPLTVELPWLLRS